MAIKLSGSPTLAAPIERFIPEQLPDNGFDLLHLELAQDALVAALPWHHRDPFDHLLAAQALDETLTIVSADPVFRKDGVKRIW